MREGGIKIKIDKEMRIEKITEDVAALMGESLQLECEAADSPFPDLASRVAILLPRLLTQLIRDAPKEQLEGWKELVGELTIDAEGVGLLTLPEDFLRFGTLRLTGWRQPVEQITQGTPWAANQRAACTDPAGEEKSMTTVLAGRGGNTSNPA